MGTLFIYVVVICVVGALLFIVTATIFGRSEELEPLPKGVSPTVLPAADVHGDDVRAARFRLRLRGYDQHDVDWTLARLADRIDELTSRVQVLERSPGRAEGSPEGADISDVDRIVPPSTPWSAAPAVDPQSHRAIDDDDVRRGRHSPPVPNRSSTGTAHSASDSAGADPSAPDDGAIVPDVDEEADPPADGRSDIDRQP